MSCEPIYGSIPPSDKNYQNLVVQKLLRARTLSACTASINTLNGKNINILYDLIDQLEFAVNQPFPPVCALTPYIVGLDCPFTTINSAIQQAKAEGANASNGSLPLKIAVVLVTPGQYVEDLVLEDGVIVSGIAEGRTRCTTVVGAHTANSGSNPLQSFIVDMNLQNPSGTCIQIQGSPFTFVGCGYTVIEGLVGVEIISTAPNLGAFSTLASELVGSTSSIISQGNSFLSFDRSTIDNDIIGPLPSGNLFINMYNSQLSDCTLNFTNETNGQLFAVTCNSNCSIFMTGNTGPNSNTVGFNNCNLLGTVTVSDAATAIFTNCNITFGNGGNPIITVDTTGSLILQNCTTLGGGVTTLGTSGTMIQNCQISGFIEVTDSSILTLTNSYVDSSNVNFSPALIISDTSLVTSANNSLFVDNVSSPAFHITRALSATWNSANDVALLLGVPIFDNPPTALQST